MSQGLICSVALAFLVAAPSALALTGSGVSFTAPAGRESGWSYVGQTWNGSGPTAGSAVYLGDYSSSYWFITAAHVGINQVPTSVNLSGNSYSIIAGSGIQLVNNADAGGGVADVYMFRVNGSAALDSLSNLTITNGYPLAGASVRSFGFGGGVESWGALNVNANNQLYNVNGGNGTVVGFEGNSATVTLIGGDSGGGVFIDNAGKWELIGLNEASGTYSSGPYSGQSLAVCTELGYYRPQILANMAAVPEPSAYGVMAGGAALGLALIRRRRRAA